MAAIVIGSKQTVWGVREPLPLEGFPQGKVRVRMRNDCVATAFVKTPKGITRFTIKEDDGKWKPHHILGRNIR
jgi:hypothetical protein